jgi:hypothetical protein
VEPTWEKLDWDDIHRVYGPNFTKDIIRLNNPTITEQTTPELIKENWQAIREIVFSTLPENEELKALMKAAGAPTTIKEIDVSPELGLEGVIYHPYMRYRMTLMRLIPMLNIPVDRKSFIE